MGEDQGQGERDAAIWSEWVSGINQAEIAERRGITQGAVSQACSRFRSTVPFEDKAPFLARALVRMERLHQVFEPLALTGDKGAARVVIQAQALEGRYLGLDSPAKLELAMAQDQVQHTPVDVRAELATLLAKIRGGDHAT
jgi:hypothetical protein